jgi:pimeloyl-ACP methyl ester carboxylesterase
VERRGGEAVRFRAVRRTAGKTAVALLTAGACVSAAPSSAPAQIVFAPCAGTNEFACGHLTVPLDPSEASPGEITLAIRRHRAPVGEERSAVIALAGGPGQAGLPFAEQFASLLGPIISTRDLIVYDQRGTGLSHPLSCHRFEPTSAGSSLGSAIAECAAQIGPARSFYTTADSVADIEAIRVAGGYERVVLYGTSYGTKLAEEYAQAYPSHVEALVLDSVVPPNGPDPLNRATFAAIPRVLRQLCAKRACAGIAPHPGADLAELVGRLGERGRRGRWIDGHGRVHTINVSSEALLEALLEGDLEPVLRAEFPAAVRSAARGDTAALARLLERATSSERSEPEVPSESFDTPLYYATTCEEGLFPWNRAASPRRRLAEAVAAIRALGPRAIAPFAPADALNLGDIPACAFWPFATPAPAAQNAPLPGVPALILSGADDLRTPTSNAREVAAQIPGSKLLVVPYSGHSVLSSDPSSCSRDALRALFARAPVKPCPSGPPPPIQRPTPLAPARLADVAPASGNRGRPGRTLDAVLLTLADVDRQLALRALAEVGELAIAATVDVGGLRSGWAQFAAGRLMLHGNSYVPGVTVSGEITPDKIELRVGGAAAARGALRLGPNRMLTGRLEGRVVRLASAGPSAVGAQAALDDLRSARRSRGGAPPTRSRLRAVTARLQALLALRG